MKADFWQIFDTGRNSAIENMRFDAHLLDAADTYVRPILHLYEWENPSATFGYFLQPSRFLNLDSALKKGLDLARRPTGGGIIFHIWDLAFSVLVPAHLREYSINTLENYHFVNHAVLSAVRDFLRLHVEIDRKKQDFTLTAYEENLSPALSLITEDSASLDVNCAYFCMAKPTKYDVLWEGKKVAGAAQRKTKKGFLHQGSISLTLPCQDYLDEILLKGSSVQEAMQLYTCPILGKNTSASQVRMAKEQLHVLLATHLNRASLKYYS